LRLTALTLTLALILWIVAWVLSGGFSMKRIAFAIASTALLWIGAWRMGAGDRRAYAWMTLAVTPYIAAAITEAVANAPARVWATTCAFLAFALFIALIACVRAMRAAH
jgi:uncharacterized membrane protein